MFIGEAACMRDDAQPTARRRPARAGTAGPEMCTVSSCRAGDPPIDGLLGLRSQPGVGGGIPPRPQWLIALTLRGACVGAGPVDGQGEDGPIGAASPRHPTTVWRRSSGLTSHDGTVLDVGGC